MYDHITTPRGPNPIITFKAPPGPSIATWKIHKSRRKHEAEVFQDLQRHPWIGVRQAGHTVNLYGTRSMGVDRDLRKVPYEVRLHNPPSGNFPLIVGQDKGTGPGPWWNDTPDDQVEARGRRRNEWRENYRWDDKSRQWKTPGTTKNKANYEDGPAV